MAPEEVISKVFGIAQYEISDTTSNKNLPQWDSLAHMTLIMELEATYKISFSASEALAMTDVGSIKRILSKYQVQW